MKRYWLFMGMNYYPSCGVQDLVGTFESLAEAVKRRIESDKTFDWWQIVDSKLGHVRTDANHNWQSIGSTL